jgi:hypothetical protein
MKLAPFLAISFKLVVFIVRKFSKMERISVSFVSMWPCLFKNVAKFGLWQIHVGFSVSLLG